MASGSDDETKTIITALLTSNPLKCTIRNLCNDFVETVGYHIPYRQLGFQNIESYLRSIPDTCHVHGTGSNAEVEGVARTTSAHINLMVQKQRKTNIPAHLKKRIRQPRRPEPATTQGLRVPAHVQNNLNKLINAFPNGLWCRELPVEYEAKFNVKLRHEAYKFRSMIEMCSDLTDIFHCVRPGHGDFLLYSKNRQIPEVQHNTTNYETERKKYLRDFLLKVSRFDWLNGPDLVPADVVSLGEVIPRYGQDLEPGGQLDIKIGEIYSIDKFYVYQTYGPLKTLKNNLSNFLKKNKNQYLIPEILLAQGLYCSIEYKDNYHRCVITNLLEHDPEHVQVSFLDYGCITFVPKSEVYYLPREFGQVPCQGIKTKLAGIKAVDTDFILTKFRDLIRNKDLSAAIVDLPGKDDTLSIYLADITDQDNIFFINDILVEKGYAAHIE